MRNINKKAILLLCFMCVCFVPQVRSMERIEEIIFLTHGSSNQFYVSLEEGEVISWEFETYNNSFLTTLTLSKNSLEFVCIEKEEGSYTIDIDETYEYHLGVWNRDDIDGYIHYIIENKKSSILSEDIFLILGIIGVVIVLTAIGYGIYTKGRRQKPRSPSHSQPQQPIHLAQKTSLKFCSECGHKLPPNTTFCTNCGKRMTRIK